MENTTEGQKTFTPPRHWVGLDELSENYWTDDRAQTLRGQEFLHKPIETLEAIEKNDPQGLARRDFLTIMGASMAMASFACARRPVEKIIPYVVKPSEITPGVANYYASSLPAYLGGYGILVRTREGRPIKLEGNPDHPVSAGRLSARAQAALLDLYDPDRLQAPAKVSGGKGSPVTWAAADADIKSALSRGGRVRLLTGRVTSPTTRRLIAEFLGEVGDAKHVEFDGWLSDDLLKAQEESYGSGRRPIYRFDRADYVVALGSDFLGADPESLANNVMWGRKRELKGQKPAGAQLGKLVAFESTMSLTGANSDERFPVAPGDELKVALALAHEIIVINKQSQFAGDAAVREALNEFSVAKVAKDIGGSLTADALKKIARELWESRGRSVVVGGDLFAQTAEGYKLQLAINLLNSALENDGATVDYASAPEAAAGGVTGLLALVDELKSGSVDVLVIHGVNPLYSLPPSLGLKEAMGKAKLVVTIADRVNETGAASGYVLAESHFLESWGDSEVRAGLVSIQQPAIRPMYDTRSFEEVLLGWMGAKRTWHAYLQDAWKQKYFQAFGGGQSFEEFWVNALQKGVVGAMKGEGLSARRFRTYSLRTLLSGRAPATADIKLALYHTVPMGDGTQANNAWLQELPEPISTATWDNFLNVGPALAKKLGVDLHDVVKVEADGYSVEVPVLVQPGMHENTVSLAVGYGRTAAGKVGDGVGANAYPFAKVVDGRLVFSGHKVKVSRTGRRYEIAVTQGHHRTMGRPIVNDITLAEYRKDPATENHTAPHLRAATPSLWSGHNYPGYRWGMSIDLTSCTGCSACVTACQAENNVPVVGRERVRTSREMHWIRIDRYYAGSAENPDVVFEPMLCQHCENAPCETVCPVLATTHSDEGLNEMTYNRCVGTRYCQNNCPYKVRRFNYFDHWKDYKGSMNMVWNPDVTVRTRGVMEKCTFCVQRINDVKQTAKRENRKVRGDEVKTACQQTCPTDAITFGDINNAEARVTQLHKEPRAFRILEDLNTKPVISYLSKVRNKEEGAAHVEHHH